MGAKLLRRCWNIFKSKATQQWQNIEWMFFLRMCAYFSWIQESLQLNRNSSSMKEIFFRLKWMRIVWLGSRFLFYCGILRSEEYSDRWKTDHNVDICLRVPSLIPFHIAFLCREENGKKKKQPEWTHSFFIAFSNFGSTHETLNGNENTNNQVDWNIIRPQILYKHVQSLCSLFRQFH